MATLTDIAPRVAFTAQALATLGASPEWDRALTAYLIADARTHARSKFGPLPDLDNERYVEELKAREKFGPQYRRHPKAAPLFDHLDKRIEEEEEITSRDYFQPLWQSQYDLALIPAPSLTAALFKVALIELAELDNGLGFAGDPHEIAMSDLARFAA